MIAFWRYDTFPYYLCGTVAEMKDGKVMTIEYGKGNWFKPEFIISDTIGLKIKEDIKNLTFEYEKAQAELKQIYINKLKDISVLLLTNT